MTTLDKPDKVLFSFKGRGVFRRKFEHKILEVVARREDDIMVVVTAYYLYESKVR